MDKIYFSDLLIDMTIIETITRDVAPQWRCGMTESDFQLLLPYIAPQAQGILQMFRSSPVTYSSSSSRLSSRQTIPRWGWNLGNTVARIRAQRQHYDTAAPKPDGQCICNVLIYLYTMYWSIIHDNNWSWERIWIAKWQNLVFDKILESFSWKRPVNNLPRYETINRICRTEGPAFRASERPCFTWGDSNRRPTIFPIRGALICCRFIDEYELFCIPFR